MRLADQLTDLTSLCLTRKRADGPLCSVISWDGNVSTALFFSPDRRKAEAGPRPLPSYVDQNGHKRTPKCFFLTWDNAIQFSPHPIIRERERESVHVYKGPQTHSLYNLGHQTMSYAHGALGSLSVSVAWFCLICVWMDGTCRYLVPEGWTVETVAYGDVCVTGRSLSAE